MPKRFHNNIKVLICICVLTLYGNLLYGQIQGAGMFFQAIARDISSNPAKDRKIYVESNIRQFTATGSIMLSEIHETNTDATGIFSISIGLGIRNGGSVLTLSSIPWDNGPFYLNLKIAISPTAPIPYWDYSKEWIDLGTTPFGIVPYALYAGNAAGMDNKVNFTDSNSVYVTPYQLKLKTFDTANLSSRINLKLNITDTASILSPYFRTVYLNDYLINKVNYSDTNAMLSNRIARDTISLSERINKKLNAADTILFTNKIDYKLNSKDTSSLSERINLKLNSNDTSVMLSNRLARDTISLSNRINLKLNNTDTASILGPYLKTALINNYIASKVSYDDTSAMLSSRIGRDTIWLSNRINLKLNIADTTSMLSPYFKSAFLNNYLNTKLNHNDTSLMLSSRIGRDTVSLSNRIDLKLNNADTNTMLSNRFARDTTWLSNRINLKEEVINKSLDIITDGFLDSKYPSTKAVKTYVDASIAIIDYLSPSGSANNLTNFPTLNQNTTGSASSLSNAYINWNAVSGGSAILNKPVLFSGSYNDLSNTPSLFSGAYSDLTGTPVQFSGSYNDLSNKPSLFSGAYSDLTGTPLLFSGSYNDLSNKPSLFSGAYSDLTGTPVLFSGSYNDLSNKPSLFSGAYTDLTGKPTLTNGTVTNVNALSINNSGTDISSSVNNGTTTPTITLNVPTASITNRGLLSASDWSTFNAKGDMTLAGVQTITGTKTFSNTIVGSINGNAATATKLLTPVTINGTAFDGSANISFSTNTVNALTINNIGTGDVSGTTFNGSAAKTISYNTIGAAPTIGSASITTLGNITTGTWNATAISVAKGGTGALTLTANAVLLGNGTSAVTTVSPSTNGNVLTSNGTTWVSSTPSTTLIREIADEFSATTLQTIFSLSQTPSTYSKVKMFINGVRISNSAYSISGTTLTYNATNNGAYSITASDRIQFDYYY
jgi:hypothetical protein